ncbi:unnamed protein product [Chironomus riparius]|uniref:Small integral membrane protein 4 n=1 Tax=Chironomus riparius TaxID=315576 RepID=A0A9N9S1Q5_9DIPT|nr:unnamed protein product [Chironomus riparius]
MLSKIIEKWPGKSIGLYRFLPAFFFLGATLEFSMIKWRVGRTNFYDTYKRKQAKKVIEERLKSINESS